MSRYREETVRRGRRRLAGILPALATAVAVAACGWQLRGSYSFPPEVAPVEVDGGGVGDILRDNLRRNEALAAEGDTPARSRVDILDEDNSRRVVSVDADGKANEYELLYQVRWQLTAPGDSDAARRVLIAPVTFEATRTFEFDRDAVLSRNEERDVLLENMREDVALRILFRLQGLRLDADGEGTAETEAPEDDG